MRPLSHCRSTTIVLTLLAACADQRTSIAHHDLEQLVSVQSEGAFTLTSFAKTNGYEQSASRRTFYILEWKAQITSQADVWKGGNAFVGYWSDFRVMRAQPGTWDNLLAGGDSREFVKGASVVLTGQSRLQKTEAGWRVVDFDVRTSQVLNNQRSPAASAELQRQQDSARAAQQQARAAEEQQLAAISEQEARDRALANEQQRLADQRADQERSVLLRAIARVFESPDCSDTEHEMPAKSELVFLLPATRECWTPWLVIREGSSFAGSTVSEDVLMQVAHVNGTTGEPFVDGPRKNVTLYSPLQKARFKSLGKVPATITFRVR